MGLHKILNRFPKLSFSLLTFSVLVSLPVISKQSASKLQKHWPQALRKKLSELESQYPDHFGLYIKDLSTGEELSYKGDEYWYVASGVKLPIAIETLRQIDEAKISLDSEIELSSDDFVDGAGETNFKSPGSRLSVRYLIQQMMVFSDNTASDLLIKTVGLDKVNFLIRHLIPKGFSEITTLADVRRLAYSFFHPKAIALKGLEFLKIKAAGSEPKKLEKLQELLHVDELQSKNFDEAFKNYYSTKVNSATLRAYAQVLEEVATGHAMKPETNEFLIRTMESAETGKKRIRSGFPAFIHFAHKTGTQYSRVCDFGFAWKDESDPQHSVVIAACTRDIKDLETAEKVLHDLGEAIYESGVFDEKKDL